MGNLGARLTSHLTGVIVAGGNATRLGGIAKGLVKIGGTRIIDRVARALEGCVDSIIIAANAPDASEWLSGARVVADALEGGGPAAGIHAALRECKTPVIAVGWDMPFVSAALIGLIADIGATHEYDAVVPAGGGAGSVEPLCAWYAPGVADAIEANWACGRRGLHDLLGGLRTCAVSADRLATIGRAERLFLNVNTPVDLDRARALAGEP